MDDISIENNSQYQFNGKYTYALRAMMITKSLHPHEVNYGLIDLNQRFKSIIKLQGKHSIDFGSALTIFERLTQGFNKRDPSSITLLHILDIR